VVRPVLQRRGRSPARPGPQGRDRRRRPDGRAAAARGHRCGCVGADRRRAHSGSARPAPADPSRHPADGSDQPAGRAGPVRPSTGDRRRRADHGDPSALSGLWAFASRPPPAGRRGTLRGLLRQAGRQTYVRGVWSAATSVRPRRGRQLPLRELRPARTRRRRTQRAARATHRRPCPTGPGGRRDDQRRHRGAPIPAAPAPSAPRPARRPPPHRAGAAVRAGPVGHRVARRRR